MAKTQPIDFRAAIRAELERRRDRGLAPASIAELARMAGVTQPKLSQYLSGVKGCNDATLAVVLNTLGFTLASPKH